MDERKYEMLVTRFIVMKGVAMDQVGGRDGYWGAGFLDRYQEISKHMAACDIKSWGSFDDDYRWTVFGGTFASHDPVMRGMQVQINCKCGQVKDTLFRYEGTTGDAIRQFIEFIDFMDIMKSSQDD